MWLKVSIGLLVVSVFLEEITVPLFLVQCIKDKHDKNINKNSLVAFFIISKVIINIMKVDAGNNNNWTQLQILY